MTCVPVDRDLHWVILCFDVKPRLLQPSRLLHTRGNASLPKLGSSQDQDTVSTRAEERTWK